MLTQGKARRPRSGFCNGRSAVETGARQRFPRYVCSRLATSYWNSQIARLGQGMFYRDQRYIEEASWERHLHRNEALMRFPSSLGATSDMAMPLRRSLESFSEPQSIEMTLLIELATI